MTAIALAEMPMEKVVDQQIYLLYLSLDAAEAVVWRRAVFRSVLDDFPSQR